MDEVVTGMSLCEAQHQLREFRDDRDWGQFHNPKDLAISINLEAAELLECFQWSGSDLSCDSKREQIEEKLADVLICALNLANALDVDAGELIKRKLALNAKKYPVDKARGNAKKYSEL